MPEEEDVGTDSGVRVSERTDTSIPKPKGGGNPGRGNRGAHNSTISTRRPAILVRPTMPSIEVGGVKYFGYDHNPIRQDKVMCVTEPAAFDLRGRKPINAYSSTEEAVDYGFVPSFRILDTLWDQAYDFLRQRAEDEKGYRHLPADLNSNDRFRQYIELYMAVRLMLGEITTWQHLSMFDRAHMQINEHARKISRSRVNGQWEALGAVPMFPTFVALADFWSKAVFGGAGGIMYHQSWPYSGDQYFWGVSAGIAVGNIGYYSPDAGPPDTPDTDAYFTNMANCIDTLLSVLTRRHSSLSANDKADIQSMQGLYRMMEMPTHPMRWDQWQPVIVDEGLLDTYLFRGAWLGIDKDDTTEEYCPYPRPDDLNGTVEIRGRGAPNPMVFSGLLVGLAALTNESTLGLTDKFSILGAKFPGISGSATRKAGLRVGVMRDARIYSDEDGWISSTGTGTYFDSSDQVSEYPYSFHQYHERGGVDAGNDLDVRANDMVDYEYYVPIDDVGSHYLAYVSQALGLPYV